MTSEPLIFDPTRPDFRADPYPIYERLRCEDPIHWCPLGFWAIPRYSDVASLLRDPRLGMGDFWTAQRAAYLRSDAAYTTIQTWMLLKDPPEHTRLRRLVSQAFTPRAVEQMRARIEGIVKELLTEPVERGALDVMTELAFPLPVYVIAEMLGVPPEDRDQFHVWTQAVNLAFEAGLTPEQVSRCNQGARELGAYLRSLIARVGKDFPQINTGVAAFVQEAEKKNFPLDIHDYPDGRHAFDIRDDTEESRQLIMKALAFVRTHFNSRSDATR